MLIRWRRSLRIRRLIPELEKTFDKLGIPLEERLALSGTAVDAIMDSVSVKTTFKKQLAEKGIIFCSIGEAVKEHPDLVRKYLGSVVPYRDNYSAALNSASLVMVPSYIFLKVSAVRWSLVRTSASMRSTLVSSNVH